jgi:hypothetical protein
VDAAMDVGAIHFVELADSFDHAGGFLRSGGAIEVDQRLPVNGLLEDRKILAHPHYIESDPDFTG